MIVRLQPGGDFKKPINLLDLRVFYAISETTEILEMS